MGSKNFTRQIDCSAVSVVLSYDPETGFLFWIHSRGRVRAGQIAGCVSGERGYIQVRCFGVSYYAHRIAWALYHSEDVPEGLEIDHRDGDTSNNKMSNLRLARPIQNKRNMAMPATNTSGYRGVTWNRRYSCWQAQISRKNTCVFLGYHKNIDDAIAARKAAENDIFGEFSFEQSRKKA